MLLGECEGQISFYKAAWEHTVELGDWTARDKAKEERKEGTCTSLHFIDFIRRMDEWVLLRHK